MCGITGFVDFSRRSSREVLVRMADVQRHRGPDDSGYELLDEPQGQVGLGFRRLAVIDLSPLANQPMRSDDGHCTIVYNGEIYNFREIRAELEKSGEQFATQSDTEVILKAWRKWGMKCVDRFTGMFAFALYDRKAGKLFLCRDRAGVKPLYYYRKNDVLLFASELKSLHEHPSFEKEINFDAVALYFRHLYVPAPHCVFKNAFKLKPGHWLELDLASRDLSVQKYWEVADAYNRPRLDISFEDAAAETEKVLSSAFEYRMVADVPVGIFLSGGYDSSAVAALLQRHRTQKLRTFTIGFHEAGYDEAPHARRVAEHLGTNHFEHYCTFREAMDIIPSLPWNYDEPFADSSAIPTTLVSRIARQHVTVALSADGGDEIFAGYRKYVWAVGLDRLFSIPPRSVSRFVSRLMKALSFAAADGLFPRDRYHKLRMALSAPDRVKMFDCISQVVSSARVRKLLIPDFSHAENAFDEAGLLSDHNDMLGLAMATDYKTYLVDDILQKVDRATMSVSLEGREPFLDHRIVEWMAQLPSDFKVKKGNKKHLLKHIVHQYIPKSIMDRPKAGFAVPVEDWLRNELKDLFLRYFDTEAIRRQGIFRPEYVRNLASAYLSRGRYDFMPVWCILMFQMWYERWMDGSAFDKEV